MEKFPKPHLWMTIITIVTCAVLIVVGIMTYDDGGVLRACRSSTGSAKYDPECPKLCWDGKAPLSVFTRYGDKSARETINRVISFYNNQTKGHLLDYKSDAGAIEIQFGAPEEHEINEGGSTTHWLNIDTGCADLAVVRIRNVPIVNEQYKILVHELGHALGLADDFSTNSVMNPSPGPSLFDDDIDRLRTLHRLD